MTEDRGGLTLVILILFVGVFGLWLYTVWVDCNERGGVLVSSPTVYECVEPRQ